MEKTKKKGNHQQHRTLSKKRKGTDSQKTFGKEGKKQKLYDGGKEIGGKKGGWGEIANMVDFKGDRVW